MTRWSAFCQPPNSYTTSWDSTRIRPGPGGRDFQQAYNCQAVVDHAHQVIVAARATNQTSDKQQAAAMMQEPSTTSVQSPGKYPPTLAITRQRRSTSFMLWAWTRSSRRSRPATAEWFRRRPEVAYPVSCPPGTGCGGSWRPNGAASVTPFGWRRCSRSSARSRRDGASGSSCCGAWKRSTANGSSSAPATTCSSCSASADWPPDEHGPPG